MINLSGDQQSLTITLANAHTTSPMEITAAYADATQGFVPGNQNSLSNGVTAATIVSAPAAGVVRMIRTISIYNSDTAVNTVTVALLDNLTSYSLVTFDVLPQETLFYSPEEGWRIINQAGSALTIVSGTWDPEVTFDTPGDFVPTYITRAGAYWNLGTLLHYSFGLQFDANAYTTALGTFRVTLPFTALDSLSGTNIDFTSPVFLNRFDNSAGVINLMGYVEGGTNLWGAIEVFDGSPGQVITTTAVFPGSSALGVWASGFYHVGS